jgi:hypothetical protein
MATSLLSSDAGVHHFHCRAKAMILNIEFDSSPIKAGESRPLKAFSNSPLTITVLCYLTTPPPPGYRPCPGGGTTSVISGEETFITADARTFQLPGGYLDVIVKDKSADVRSFRLPVIVRSEGQTVQGTMAGE